MLTGITATMTNREVQSAAPRKRVVHVPLLLFRRLRDQALHEAKKTHEGMPTRAAMLERTWFEQHCEPKWPGWETSFSNCCLMIGLDENEDRREALRQIDRAWQKALTDWGRRRREEILDELRELKATDNPAWAKRHAIQEDLPIPEPGDVGQSEMWQ